MKKSLIALSVAAAFSAPAFADVSVYGIVDGALANVSNTGQRSQTLVVSGGLAGSRLGVKATEDVGDGLTALGVLEYSLDTAVNASIGGGSGKVTSNGTIIGAGNNIGTAAVGTARQQLVGLSSAGMGTVALGYLQTTGYDFATKYDPTAGTVISPTQNMTSSVNGQFLIGNTAAASRAQRAVAYISPNMGGFSLAVNYATALAGTGNLGALTSAADANVTATLVSANYDVGPLAVGGVYASTSNPVSTNNLKEYALGASYDMGAAKLSATYQSNKKDTTGAAANNNKVYSLGGVIPTGSGAAVLSYAHATIGTDTTGNSNGTSYTLAYLHNMSKTLTAYAGFSRVTNGSTGTFSVANSGVASGQAASASSNLTAIGLSKRF